LVTSERKLAIRVDGRDDCSSGALPLPLGGHRDLSGGTSRLGISGKQRNGRREKVKLGLGNKKRHVGASINGVSWVGHYL
jgi:hypothetical protein